MSTANPKLLQLREIENEMSRHLEDVKLNRAAHFNKSGRLQKMSTMTNSISYISLWGLVILWFISTQIFDLVAQLGFSAPSYVENITTNLLPVIFVVFGLLGTTLQYFGGYGELSRSHWRAAMRYQRLFRKIKNWRTECPCELYAEIYMRDLLSIRQELTDINEDSPDFDVVDWKAAKKSIELGGSDYEVDQK